MIGSRMKSRQCLLTIAILTLAWLLSGCQPSSLDRGETIVTRAEEAATAESAPLSPVPITETALSQATTPPQSAAATPTAAPAPLVTRPIAAADAAVVPTEPGPDIETDTPAAVPSTPTPDLTAPASVVPLSDKPIGGYVFGTPEVIANTYGHSIRLLGALPNQENRIIVFRDTHLEILDSETGEIRRFWDKATTTNMIFGTPTWIPEERALAIVIDPENSGNYELWFTFGDEDLPPQQIVANLASGIAPGSDPQDLLFLNRTGNLQQINARTLQGQASPLQLPTDISNTKFLQVAAHPTATWLAYYNSETIFLVNSNTNQVRDIDLGRLGEDQYRVIKAEWSPDGEQLGLLTAAGNFPISASNLQVFNLETGTLEVLQDTFQFINDFTWTPNNRQLVISAVIGTKAYQLSETESFVSTTSALFLANILTGEILPLPLISNDIASSGKGIHWSSSGEVLIAWYREFQGSIALYKVEVSQP